jgi:hypothetical protein
VYLAWANQPFLEIQAFNRINNLIRPVPQRLTLPQFVEFVAPLTALRCPLLGSNSSERKTRYPLTLDNPTASMQGQLVVQFKNNERA